MDRVAVFEKVSFEQYVEAWKKQGRDLSTEKEMEKLKQEWEDIRLPVRATSGSAGYDFFMPRTTIFYTNLAKFFPTGIRCKIKEGWFLALLPKSGLGTKYGTKLVNTMGVVDSDYYYSDNEGHIHAGFMVHRDLCLEKGDKFMQGILIPFGITEDDDAKTIRNGGFGSTGA